MVAGGIHYIKKLGSKGLEGREQVSCWGTSNSAWELQTHARNHTRLPFPAWGPRSLLLPALGYSGLLLLRVGERRREFASLALKAIIWSKRWRPPHHSSPTPHFSYSLASSLLDSAWFLTDLRTLFTRLEFFIDGVGSLIWGYENKSRGAMAWTHKQLLSRWVPTGQRWAFRELSFRKQKAGTEALRPSPWKGGKAELLFWEHSAPYSGHSGWTMTCLGWHMRT